MNLAKTLAVHPEGKGVADNTVTDLQNVTYSSGGVVDGMGNMLMPQPKPQKQSNGPTINISMHPGQPTPEPNEYAEMPDLHKASGGYFDPEYRRSPETEEALR